jgi:hypothetical protein
MVEIAQLSELSQPSEPAKPVHAIRVWIATAAFVLMMAWVIALVAGNPSTNVTEYDPTGIAP